MQMNGDVTQAVNEKDEALDAGISGEKHPLDLSTPRKRQNDFPPSGKEVDIIDFDLDSDVSFIFIYFILKLFKQIFLHRRKRWVMEK